MLLLPMMPMMLLIRSISKSNSSSIITGAACRTGECQRTGLGDGSLLEASGTTGQRAKRTTSGRMGTQRGSAIEFSGVVKKICGPAAAMSGLAGVIWGSVESI